MMSKPPAPPIFGKDESRVFNDQEPDDVDVEKQAGAQRQFEPIKNAGDHAAPPALARTRSSDGGDGIQPVVSYKEAGDEVYSRFSPRRKNIMTAILSLCGFLSPMSSTTILAAVPEVAATYDTTGSIINVSNALYLIAMGISPMFWGPVGQTYGRRWVSVLPPLADQFH